MGLFRRTWRCPPLRLLLVGTLVFLLGGMPYRPALAGADAFKAVRLFGTVEFRTSLKVLPRWERVRERAADQVARLAEGSGGAAAIRNWRRMMVTARAQPVMAQLKTVNHFFNQWPYRLDREVYGASDHWATPEEFMNNSGDCEDFGIAKYYTLRRLGVDPARLRIVVVRDRIRGIGHAVLAVYLADGAYILDNLTDQVLPHTKYRHYLPQYSVNENHGWAHLPAQASVAAPKATMKKTEPAGVDRQMPGSDVSGKDP